MNSPRNSLPKPNMPPSLFERTIAASARSRRSAGVLSRQTRGHQFRQPRMNGFSTPSRPLLANSRMDWRKSGVWWRRGRSVVSWRM